MRERSRPASRRIVFYDRPGWERLSPAAIDSTGLGGSETALVRVAAGLAARGHQVTVYADTSVGVVDGVAYRPCERWDPSDPADAVVVSRLPEMFDHQIAAPIRVFWCHDAFYNGLTPERTGDMTSVVVLSDWQRDFFATRAVSVSRGQAPDHSQWNPAVRRRKAWPLRGGASLGERAPRCVLLVAA